MSKRHQASVRPNAAKELYYRHNAADWAYIPVAVY